jgi:hypothetical protein
MSPELMYIKFLDKINKGNSGGGIDCDKERFVRIINECKNRWVERGIKDKDSILIDSYQEIIKTKNLLNPSDTTTDYTEFPLDEDFYEAILAKCVAEKGKCKKVLYSREVKNQNKNFLQFDESTSPDFEWEWTFNSIQSNKIRIYKKDFNISSAVLEYYKVIPDIQMEGTVNIDGDVVTQSIGIDISEQYVDQIINLAAKEFEMNYQNQIGIQVAQERINSQE